MIDVLRALLRMGDMPLFFQYPQERANRRIAGWIGQFGQNIVDGGSPASVKRF